MFDFFCLSLSCPWTFILIESWEHLVLPLKGRAVSLEQVSPPTHHPALRMTSAHLCPFLDGCWALRYLLSSEMIREEIPGSCWTLVGISHPTWPLSRLILCSMVLNSTWKSVHCSDSVLVVVVHLSTRSAAVLRPLLLPEPECSILLPRLSLTQPPHGLFSCHVQNISQFVHDSWFFSVS